MYQLEYIKNSLKHKLLLFKILRIRMSRILSYLTEINVHKIHYILCFKMIKSLNHNNDGLCEYKIAPFNNMCNSLPIYCIFPGI